ncbi:MAG TPA: VOC family protein [Candidatus Acidoferrum sp.]|nr:VOC family protein [Candidatus Acidoferrum sp.]
MKRTGESFMPADDYGRGMRQFSVNLLVRDLQASLTFYKRVLEVAVRYADDDFAVLKLLDFEFLLHVDHTYDQHPLYERLKTPGVRGTGAELRVLGIDPDSLEKRAREAGATIIQSTRDFPHGWRDVMVADPDGYIWAVGVPIPKSQ